MTTISKDLSALTLVPPKQQVGAGFPQQRTPTAAKPTAFFCAVLFGFIVGYQGSHFVLRFNP